MTKLQRLTAAVRAWAKREFSGVTLTDCGTPYLQSLERSAAKASSDLKAVADHASEVPSEKPPFKSEPLLNLTIAERETLLASLDRAAMNMRLAPEVRAEQARRAAFLRSVQVQRIQQLCAALGASCEKPAVLRADRPADEHESAIDNAWDVIISSTAKKLGWQGEPASQVMGLAALAMPVGAAKAELYRKAALIRALETHRPSPLGAGELNLGRQTAHTPFDERQAAVERALDAYIAATARKMGWEGEPTSAAMYRKSMFTPKGPLKTELSRNAGLIKKLEELRATASAAPAPVSSPAPTVPTRAVQGMPVDLFVSNRTATPAPTPADDAPTHQTDHLEAISMKKAWQWPTVRTAAMVAAMLAVVSFFFISNYRPSLSIIGNIMTGYIRYEPACLNPFDAFDTPCGGNIPYRWILAALAAFVGVVALKQRKP